MPRAAFRLDHDSGLLVPAFTADEREAIRSRMLDLLQRVYEGKATPKEEAELIRLDRDLYGPGSGWSEDPRTAASARAVSRELLAQLDRTGVLTTRDVVVRGGTGGEWVDAKDVAG